jgi:hypothetical protein
MSSLPSTTADRLREISRLVDRLLELTPRSRSLPGGAATHASDAVLEAVEALEAVVRSDLAAVERHLAPWGTP